MGGKKCRMIKDNNKTNSTHKVKSANNTTPRPPKNTPTARLALNVKIDLGGFARFFESDWWRAVPLAKQRLSTNQIQKSV